MAQRKTPSSSKINREPTAAPKRAQRDDMTSTPTTTAAPAVEDIARMANPSTTTAPAVEDIARLAYEKYLARGQRHGDDVADWLAAEAELGASARH